MSSLPCTPLFPPDPPKQIEAKETHRTGKSRRHHWPCGPWQTRRNLEPLPGSHPPGGGGRGERENRLYRRCGISHEWIHGMIIHPIASMYGIFTYIDHKNQPNVNIYIYHTWMVWLDTRDLYFNIFNGNYLLKGLWLPCACGGIQALAQHACLKFPRWRSK